MGCVVRNDKIPRDDESGDTMPPSGRTPQQILKEILTRHLDHRADKEFASFLEEHLEYDISAPQEHKNLPFINRDMRNLLNQRMLIEQNDDTIRPVEIKRLEGVLEEMGEEVTNAIMTAEEEDEVLMEAFIHRAASARKGRCPNLALHSNQGEVVIAIVNTRAQFSLISKETLFMLDSEAVIRQGRVRLSGLGTAISKGWSTVSFRAENKDGRLINISAEFLIMPGDFPCLLGIPFLDSHDFKLTKAELEL